MNISKQLPLIGAAILTLANSATANLLTPTSWARSAANSTYADWDIFTTPAGPNAPSAGAFNPNGIANTFDSSGGSFVTSGGNIYSFSIPELINSIIPQYGLGASHYTTVMLQTRTMGTEANYAEVRLTYSDGTDLHTIHPAARSESDRISLGGFGGFQVDVAYAFYVPFNPTSLTILIPSSESSMSLDRVVVDTITAPASAGFFATPVPEPASLGALSVLGVLVTRRNRRAF